MDIVQVKSATGLHQDKLGQALSRAFRDEPNFTYIIPDDNRRKTILKWFFGAFVARLGIQYGQVYVPENRAGGAVWSKPGKSVKVPGAIKAGLLKMPLYLRFDEMKRSMGLSKYVEQIRNEYAPESHWCLMALGVDPALQGMGMGSLLMNPVLSLADSECTGCYLETFSLKSRKFYKKFGFRVIEEHQVQEAGPVFWSMSRKPQNQRV